MAERALSLDLDGVVYKRPPIQTMGLAMYLRRGSSIYEAIDPIPTYELSEIARDSSPSLRKRLFRATLARRQVPIDVRNTLRALDQMDDAPDIYGNTGRIYDERMVALTDQTLESGGIDLCIQRVYYRPPGLSTRESKLAVVAMLRQKYGHVTHVDDNPADGLPIAATFPDVNVVILQDLTTGILFARGEIEQFPNARRVATFREAVLQ